MRLHVSNRWKGCSITLFTDVLIKKEKRTDEDRKEYTIDRRKKLIQMLSGKPRCALIPAAKIYLQVLMKTKINLICQMVNSTPGPNTLKRQSQMLRKITENDLNEFLEKMPSSKTQKSDSNI